LISAFGITNLDQSWCKFQPARILLLPLVLTLSKKQVMELFLIETSVGTGNSQRNQLPDILTRGMVS
jgi:hypothetical protein